ncbi:hypothetical protein B296_00048335 [Ensete ventricosum]|uniref:Uncharacterized protein n=1 Tax=Ensete ventricosum TaxID=4639 RepID=A0A426XIU6_ENSVE|nr:hypothetical protein B296_00048335 [Ensete ventricosum]
MLTFTDGLATVCTLHLVGEAEKRLGGDDQLPRVILERASSCPPCPKGSVSGQNLLIGAFIEVVHRWTLLRHRTLLIAPKILCNFMPWPMNQHSLVLLRECKAVHVGFRGEKLERSRSSRWAIFEASVVFPWLTRVLGGAESDVRCLRNPLCFLRTHAGHKLHVGSQVPASCRRVGSAGIFPINLIYFVG